MAERGRRRPVRKPIQQVRREKRKRPTRMRVTPKLPIERVNIILLWIGIAFVVLSFLFLLLDFPIIFVVLSVLGYVGIIPVALIYAKKKPLKVQPVEKVAEERKDRETI